MFVTIFGGGQKIKAKYIQKVLKSIYYIVITMFMYHTLVKFFIFH